MSHVVITELGFQATPDVTLIDTTWIQLVKHGGHYGGVPEQAAITLRGIADALAGDDEVSSDKLVLEALKEVTAYLTGENR